MKILAMYLPQYHRVKENDIWWGEGYTEWEAVKNAKPFFEGHDQPKVPLNDNYYDLSDENGETWKWQAHLARKYGVYGFCIYHYWFGEGRQLLERPIEILLTHPEIDINYCICWANESWTRTWYGLESEILMEQKYGDDDEWERHFNYLLPFFKDLRYIKIDNKPLINLHRSTHISKLGEMKKYWDALARKNGFKGVYIVAANTGGELESRSELVDAYYNFEPGYTLNHKIKPLERLIYGSGIWFKIQYNRLFNKKLLERVVDSKKIYRWMNRDTIKCKKPIYKGTFPMWDNTPRRSYKGLYYKNSSPELFKISLELIKSEVSEDEFVYINSWNEWGEGCYLEPDNKNKYNYLEAISEINNANEK